MRKSRARRNRRIHVAGVLPGHKYVERELFNVTMDPFGYTAVVHLNDVIYRVAKPKFKKRWTVLSPV